MSTIAAWLRGTAATLNALTLPGGLSWVIAVDYTVKRLRLFDGTTLGGIPMARLDDAVLRNYLSGLTLSNNVGTPNTKVDIAAGQAANSTNAFMMNSSGALVVDCGVVGANGIDAGSLANSTWYHVFLIAKADGTVAGLISTSPTAPTMPATYVYFRRVGSVRTNGSAQFISFIQRGRYFYWLTSVQDLGSGSVTTTPTLQVLTVPTGVRVRPLARIGNTSGNPLMVSGPDVTQASAAAFTNTPGFSMGAGSINSQVFEWVYTDTSAQIRLVSSGTATVTVYSDGWVDDAGMA